jgi:hypothetical protein
MNLAAPFCGKAFLEVYQIAIQCILAVTLPILSRLVEIFLGQLWGFLVWSWVPTQTILLFLVFKKLDQKLDSISSEFEFRNVWILIKSLILELLSGVKAAQALAHCLKIIKPDYCSFWGAEHEFGAATFNLWLPSGKVKDWSIAAIELLGLVPDECLGYALDHIMVDERETQKLYRFCQSTRARRHAIFRCHQTDGQKYYLLVLGYLQESEFILNCVSFRVANPYIMKFLILLNKIDW